MAISYPLAIIQAMIRSPKAKKVYSIITGAFILQFCFGTGYVFLFLF